MAGGRQVIRYDIRDAGRSTGYPAGTPGYGLGDLVADAAALLDQADPGAHPLMLNVEETTPGTPDNVRLRAQRWPGRQDRRQENNVALIITRSGGGDWARPRNAEALDTRRGRALVRAG
jgi:hypothetical protein